MSLNRKMLVSKMLKVFKSKLSDEWSEIKYYAKAESKKLAENFKMIEKMKLSGQINEEQAKLYHYIQKDVSRAVLLTVKGLEILAVEKAINAAMDVLKETVNEALDFALL